MDLPLARVVEELATAGRDVGGVLGHVAGEERRRPDGRVARGARPRRVGERLVRGRGRVRVRVRVRGRVRVRVRVRVLTKAAARGTRATTLT